MSPTPDQIAQLAPGRVLVIGDVMVDHYVIRPGIARLRRSAGADHPCVRRTLDGRAARPTSPPTSRRSAAGPSLVGVVGDGCRGTILPELISPMSGIACDAHLVAEAGRPTTIKTRYMGGQHQIVRVDREQPAPISKASGRQR